MNAITISVVMSVYKEPVEWIRQSVDSILNQTFRDFEFIIVNDNPEGEEQKNLLEEYATKDGRIRLLNNQKNEGLTVSLNEGLAKARGKYIARMDADDISSPERFLRQVNFLDAHKDVGVCGSAIRFFGNKKGTKMYPTENRDSSLYLESCFAHPSVMIRRTVLDTFDIKYNEKCKVSQDYDLWVTLFEKGIGFYNFKEPLLDYRYSDIQVMKMAGQAQIATSKRIRRRALACYYQQNNMEFPFISDKWSLSIMNYVIKDLKLTSKNKSTFIYYSYLSLEMSFIEKLYNLLISGDFLKISLLQILYVLYFSLRAIDNSKY